MYITLTLEASFFPFESRFFLLESQGNCLDEYVKGNVECLYHDCQTENVRAHMFALINERKKWFEFADDVRNFKLILPYHIMVPTKQTALNLD